jgi:ribose 5-phosphate isomerase B
MSYKAKLFLACDHAAFQEKAVLFAWLQSKKIEVIDLGCPSSDRCDYPNYAIECAKKIQQEPESRGILICGSGIGMSMVANRFRGIRAALVRNEEEAKLSRSHNNANVLCLGARLTSVESMKKIIECWFTTEFEGGRHEQRIALFNNLGL